MGRRGRLLLADDEVFFVTTSVVGFARVFVEDTYCDILINNIKHYQQQYGFIIFGYVIMPSHFHWIVYVQRERGSISDIMRDIKKYSSWDLMQTLRQNGRTAFNKLFLKEALSYDDQSRKFWMKRFDDQVIRNTEMLSSKLNYVHDNPVKAGLVVNPEDYKYSSARNYILGDHSVLAVDCDWF
jgi:REP element-mobilizing transposase RayT